MSDKEYVATIKKICSLLQSDPTPEVIQSLRDAFANLSIHLKAGPFLEVFETTLSNIPFAALFSLLAAPDNKLIVAVAEVAGQLLKPVTWAMVHQTFEEYIIQGLAHPHPVVKCLVLNQFLKCEQKTDPFSAQYSPYIWKCLEGKSDTDATKLAKQVLIHLCETGMDMDYLFAESSLDAVRAVLEGDESQRFRVYDVVAVAVGCSDDVFELLRQEGIVDTFVKEGDSDDALAVMNWHELIPAVCTSEAAFSYLDSVGVFTNALSQFTADESSLDATHSFTRVSLLKLFSRMVDAQGINPAEFLVKYDIAPTLGKLISESSSETDLQSTAISCLGAIGNNTAALEHLATEKTALTALVEAYNGSISGMRVNCLQTIACIFGHLPEPTKTSSQTCYELYTQLAQGKFLVSVTQEIMKGFEESCVAGFAVIQKMALHAWGVREIASYKNVVNFLLTRDPSKGKTAQQWQFSTIETIVESREAKDAFDSDAYSRLTKYVKEGPYYVSTMPQVAIKSS
ncbi:26S proteasome non-ATPase regulatory subunit 5 [Coemansia spiralis]|nr:26S proteasome non-ATPase regulatory subunit 5 [Coemansia spiralis]